MFNWFQVAKWPRKSHANHFMKRWMHHISNVWLDFNRPSTRSNWRQVHIQLMWIWRHWARNWLINAMKRTMKKKWSHANCYQCRVVSTSLTMPFFHVREFDLIRLMLNKRNSLHSSQWSWRHTRCQHQSILALKATTLLARLRRLWFHLWVLEHYSII